MNCDSCFKKFKTKCGLTKHTRKQICLINKFKCEYCNSTFKHKNSYYRHRKHDCEVKKLEDQLKNQEIIIKEKDELILKLQQKDKLKNKIDGDHNIIGNENKVVNIHINNCGNEDTSKISQQEWIKLAKQYYNIITSLVDKIHIQEESNRNVYIKDDKSNKALRLDKDKWTIMKKDELLNDLFYNQLDRVTDILDDHKEILSKELTNDKYGNVYNKLNFIKEDIAENKIKNNKDDIELLLLNHKELIKKSQINQD